MRRRPARFAVGAVLALAWMVSAGAYVERATACASMIAANGGQMPPCCLAAKRTRIHAPMSDCCEEVWSEAGPNATVRGTDPPPFAQWTIVPAREVIAAIRAPVVRVHARCDAPEHPPPLADVLQSTVLLI